MRRDNEINKPIRNLQRALRRLSYEYESIPAVVPDGIFGEDTENAVKAFQRQFNLPQTGVVNQTTWDKIIVEYEKLLEKYTEGRTVAVFPSPFFLIELDDENEIVLVVQALIAGLSNRYDNFNRAEITGRYSQKDMDNIKTLQQISGLPQTGIVDKNTWDALAQVFESDISKSRTNPFDKESQNIIARDLVLYAPYNNDDYRL